MHREFHYGPDEDEDKAEEHEVIVDTTGHIPREKENNNNEVKRNSSVPPESQFQHLKPSENRYSFRHDEF